MKLKNVCLSPLIPPCLLFPLLTKVGQHLVRINLSEATDMMDLLGADLPAEGGAPGQVIQGIVREGGGGGGDNSKGSPSYHMR